MCALLLAACSNGEAAPSGSADSSALSGAPTGDVSAPAGQAEPEPVFSSVPTSEPAPAATEYGSGVWIVEATKDGDIPSLERLEFQDGELVYHYFSSMETGKGSYGRDGSDELELSLIHILYIMASISAKLITPVTTLARIMKGGTQ